MNVASPLKTLLRDPIDEAMAHRVLMGVRERRASMARRPFVAKPWAVGLAALLACISGGGWLLHRAPHVHEELTLADGTKFGNVEAIDMKTVRLGDGSELVLAAGSKLVPVVNASNLLVLRLDAGSVTFDVHPGGPRHWSIEGGLATVDVTGTRFTVKRDASLLRVDVERGAVLVRGANVPGSSRRLVAGERLVVTAPPEPAASSENDRMSQAPRAAPSATGLIPGTPRRAPETPRGHRNRATVTALLNQADQARAEGHPERAVEPLRKIVERMSFDPRAAGAAFTLGKLLMDGPADWTDAERAFAEAIALGLPVALEEDAYARLVEAHARAGDRAGARGAMDAYLARFPNGSRARAMQRWLDRP